MKAGKELENYVQFVYQKLLDFMDEGAMVSSNVSVIGKSGVKHPVVRFMFFIGKSICVRIISVISISYIFSVNMSKNDSWNIAFSGI